MRMFQGVQAHGICIDRLIIIVVYYVMFRARFEGMQLDLVSAHVAASAEGLAAHVAMMIFNARVGDHVFRQIAGSVEGFLAQRADLIPHTAVDLLMRLKVAQCRELL